MIITRVRELRVAELDELVADSVASGWRHLGRLCDEWASGQNHFDRPGEGLFMAHAGDRAIGICGLNVDPYAQDAAIGRLRRLYVLRTHRRSGAGRALVGHVLEAAQPWFSEVRLRTDDPIAVAFYNALGFEAMADTEDYTHVLRPHP